MSGEGADPRDPGEPPALRRLDPDRARPAVDPVESAPPADDAEVTQHDPVRLDAPVAVDTRRYRLAIGVFGLILVAVVSVYQFAANGVAQTGVAPGHRLHWFAAPLANTNLIGDPNLRPPCTEARHDPRALNICLIAASHPLVLSFFVIGSTACENQVDTLQRLSHRYPTLRFAAVAVEGSRADTAALIRSHRWTIPVAYDRDGSIGGIYGVAVCPMAELALRGGIVHDRLVGDQWQTISQIEPRVAALARAAGGVSGGDAARGDDSRSSARAEREPETALAPAAGFIAPAVAAEFPGLRLVWATTQARRRASPRAVSGRLAAAANRYRGASVIAMRTKPVPRAYRSFFRQIGLDPDVQHIPAERAALRRLMHGGFRSSDLITDACLIALIETGVPIYALDADRVAAGGLGIRPVTAADLTGAPRSGAAAGLEVGALAVADADGVHGFLFADPEPDRAPGPRTERITLFAVGVDGVPDVHIEEAVWIALEILAPASASA